MPAVPDFTNVEQKLANQTLLERYGEAVPIEIADAEIELIPGSGELTTCPVLHWQARGANFVVFKIAESRYRGQFYYSDVDHYGTGKDAFDNLGDCLITLLQVQSDDERNRAGIKSGMNAFTIGKPEDYDGPIVI